MKVAVIYNKMHADASDVINIFGPQTKEKYNPETVELVEAALVKGGHNVKKIQGNINVAEALQNFMPKVIAGERPGMVFNMAYGIQGQSRYTHIPAILEMLGVPYVGSGPQAHAVALDKVMSKILFKQHNLPTPDFCVFSTPDEEMKNLEFPVIVKPKMEAVSMGLRVVNNEKELKEAVLYIIDKYQQQALVEKFIPGREFAIGILGNGAEQQILPIVEFDFKGDPDAIQTKTNKMKKPVKKISPVELPAEVTVKIQRIAQGAFNILNLCDFARVDLRMDKDGNVYILEINSMASLGKTGSYVHSAKVAGYSYDSLVNKMLDVAAVRYFGTDFLQLETKAQEKSREQPLRIRIRSFLRGHLTTMENNLRLLVGMNSHVHNIDGVNSMGQWITGKIEQLGFKKSVFPHVNMGNCLYFTNHDEQTNDILIWDHLDNRYTHQEYVYFQYDRGRILGSGVAENKGGLAILLTALRSLRYTKRLRKVKCGILLTTDYNLGGTIGKKLIEEYTKHSRYIVGLKWGEAHGGIVTSCYGRAAYIIELTNDKSEDETIFPDVISILSEKIVKIKKLSSVEENMVVIPTGIEGKTWIGKIPDYAKVSIVLQFQDKVKGDFLINEINKIVRKRLGKKIKFRIRKEYYRPPVKENDSIKTFYNGVKNIADLLEIRIKPFTRVISTDLSYVPEGTPVLDGLGPNGGSTLTPNEYIIQDTLLDRAILLALIIDRSAKGFQIEH